MEIVLYAFGWGSALSTICFILGALLGGFLGLSPSAFGIAGGVVGLLIPVIHASWKLRD